MYKISHETINFIERTMKNGRVESTPGGKSLAETKIQRGIFQGYALSRLLFIIARMPLVTHSQNARPDTNVADRKERSTA